MLKEVRKAVYAIARNPQGGLWVGGAGLKTVAGGRVKVHANTFPKPQDPKIQFKAAHRPV